MQPVDLLIVTALAIERDAVLRQAAPDAPARHHGALTYYHFSLGGETSQQTVQVALVMLGQMGNVDAAQRASMAIEKLEPQTVLMVGIAGGVKDRASLGDVLVGDQVLYYEQATRLTGGTQLRPRYFSADGLLLDRAFDISRSDWQRRIDVHRPDGRASAATQLCFGPLACGEKVIRDSVFLQDLVDEQPKLLGVEMESFGVALAAARASHQTRFLAIRGVADYADSTKDDAWHEFAAAAAASFALALAQAAMPTRAPRTQPAAAPPVPKHDCLILIRHQSMEYFREAEYLAALPPELQSLPVRRIEVDQSDLYRDGRLVDPQEAARRQWNLASQVTDLTRRLPDAAIAYYGIAHIPLLFLAGFQLSNKFAIYLAEHDRYSAQWTLLEKGGPIEELGLEMPLRESIAGDGDVVLRCQGPTHREQ
ncbi:MAG: SAVED domain-containing protein [Anaerolineales bacterium]|nr:SAVED domain-containing protein [Anaerolineales bacterium]